MAKHGGKRKGAGRKSHSVVTRKDHEARRMFKEAFDKVITPEVWEEMLLDAIADKKSFPYYVDQRMGKASQAVDVTSKGEQLEGLVIIKDGQD